MEKKIEFQKTNLGKKMFFSEGLDDFMRQICEDAATVGHEIEKTMRIFDLSNPYDRAVMKILVANIFAGTVANLERVDCQSAACMMSLYRLNLEEYRKWLREIE